MPFVSVFALWALWLSGPMAGTAHAGGGLPYTVRSKSFNGFNSSVRGDIRTMGMSGAAVGLADTFIAGTLNPAGLALALDNADANFASQTVYDGAIQSYDSPLYSSNLGTCMNVYPWGMSIGYVAPYSEGDIYTPSTSPGNGLEVSVKLRELHASVARLILDDKLSVGFDFILGEAIEMVNPLAAPSSGGSATSLAVGGTLGALYQFPQRLLLGLSLSMPMHYAGDETSQPTPALPGFLKPVEVPGTVGLGLGWIPNRFFRADMTTFLVGTSPNTALIRDESAVVGTHPVLEPRLGIAYKFMDTKPLKATVFAGTYYEESRIAGSPNRTHITWGAEVQPWVLTLGWGIDSANSYSSYLVSVGVDFIRVMAKLDVIPQPWRPPDGGFLPNPFRISSDGLARQLDPDWKPRGPDMNPVSVGLGIPARLMDVPQKLPQKVLDSGTDIKDAGKAIYDSVTDIPGRIKDAVAPEPEKNGQ